MRQSRQSAHDEAFVLVDSSGKARVTNSRREESDAVADNLLN